MNDLVKIKTLLNCEGDFLTTWKNYKNELFITGLGLNPYGKVTTTTTVFAVELFLKNRITLNELFKLGGRSLNPNMHCGDNKYNQFSQNVRCFRDDC
jgi:hypothetical protein